MLRASKHRTQNSELRALEPQRLRTSEPQSSELKKKMHTYKYVYSACASVKEEVKVKESEQEVGKGSGL